jgi:cbb3-type cytochrome oxidase maturation protein
VSVIFLVLPLALIVVLAAVAAFAWAARRGQFDDLETPAIRMLYDEEEQVSSKADPKVEGEPKGDGEDQIA